MFAAGEIRLPEQVSALLRFAATKSVRPLFVGRLELDQATGVPAPAPARQPEHWWPKDRQTLKAWCLSAEVIATARLRMTCAGEALTRKGLARELAKMWEEAGRSPTTPEAIEQTLIAGGQ
jgi:hypothetical protein